jgi:glycosyltransferase involved in cell wall biosynthesis
MTIVVNGRFLGQPLTGVQRFAAECLRALQEEISARDGTPPIVRRPPRALACGPVGYLWEQVVLAWHGRGAIVLSLANLGPLALRRQVVLLHDAAIYDLPASYRRAYRFVHRLVHRGLLERGAKLATVSQFSRERLSAVLGVAPEEITVTGAGCDHVDRVAPNPSVLDRLGLRPNTYVLAVASRAPHKNLALLERAAPGLAARELRVVLVGGSGRPFSDPHHTPSGILAAGRVDDGELRALYESAFAFVFPSRYEGFGIPPLEAMRLGCPVLVAAVRPLLDHLAEAALTFPPDDPAALVAAATALRSDPSLRAELIARGKNVAARWRWADVGRTVLSLLETVASSSSLQLRRARTAFVTRPGISTRG